MAALVTAKLYFAVGVPFEKAWLPRPGRPQPELKVVHTEAGLAVKATTVTNTTTDTAALIPISGWTPSWSRPRPE